MKIQINLKYFTWSEFTNSHLSLLWIVPQQRPKAPWDEPLPRDRIKLKVLREFGVIIVIFKPLFSVFSPCRGMQNSSKVFQLLRWKCIENNGTYQSKKQQQRQKNPNQNEKLHLPQILRWGFELFIQNSETAQKSQSIWCDKHKIMLNRFLLWSGTIKGAL